MTEKDNLLQALSIWKGQRVLLAYSGGVDSVYLLKMLRKADVQVLAVTLDTFLHPKGDAETACRIAESMGAEHRILTVNEFSDCRILENPPERCYYCKRMLFSALKKLAEEEQIEILLDGTNADDHKVYRPGLRALKELGIRSPLAECGLTKAQIRAGSEKEGLPTAHAPSTPCLATRLPYGTRLDPALLSRVEQGEAFLRDLGFYNVRLRTDGREARLEVDVNDFSMVLQHRDEIVNRMQELSFEPVVLDLEGFRSGSYDRMRGL